MTLTLTTAKHHLHVLFYLDSAQHVAQYACHGHGVRVRRKVQTRLSARTHDKLDSSQRETFNKHCVQCWEYHICHLPFITPFNFPSHPHDPQWIVSIVVIPLSPTFRKNSEPSSPPSMFVVANFDGVIVDGTMRDAEKQWIDYMI